MIMIKGLESRMVYSVKESVNNILKETVGTSVPVDVKEIINKRYPSGFDKKLPEGLNIKQSNKTHGTYAVAMLIVRQEYFNLHQEILTPLYASVGARYLLMPYKGFSQNTIDHEFNLISMKEIYTNVSFEAIAYHFVDEFPCAVRKWQEGEFHDMCITDEWEGTPDSLALKKYEHAVIRGIIEDSLQMNTVDIDVENDRKISGWNIGKNKVMLVYF